jgi:hypothetical protein
MTPFLSSLQCRGAKMAHKKPHRVVTTELPVEDWKLIDEAACEQQRSKNSLLQEWIAPMLSLLRCRKMRAETAEAE